MQKAKSVPTRTRSRVRRSLAVCAVAAALVAFMVVVLMWPAQPALAQSGPNGTITQDTSAQFSAACAVLPGVAAAPSLSGTIVSPVNGGEIRLRATVEDYFDGNEIDATQWISGYSNPANPLEVPTIGGGLLTLYGSYLRSQTVFTGTQSPRFFEARAQFVGDGLPSPTNGDIGFYRVLPPLQVPPGDESSIRLFVSQPFNSVNNRLMYVRSRDGTTQPVVDSLVDNWTDDEPTQRIGLSVFRNFRIDWGVTDTWYSIDGSTIITAGIGDNPLPHTGVATRTTYVFLYNQDPEVNSPDPLLIDWVRAGQYPAAGSYTSCAQDAGQVANWSQVTVSSTLPSGTAGTVETRTSLDGITWSAWTTAGALVNGSGAVTPSSPSGRYFQYRVLLATTNPLQSPEVQLVAAAYFGPSTIVVAPPSATLDPGASQQFAAAARDSNNALVVGVPFAWSIRNSGGTVDGSGLFTAGLPAGAFAGTVWVTVTSTLSGTADVVVRDLAPVADAGGPYTGAEGLPVALSAAASTDPNGGPLAYAWDLDNDGAFNDALGVSASYTWPDNGTFTVGVLVTDTAGLTDTATAAVSISNRDPVISSVANSGPVRRTQPVTVTITAGDVAADPLLYSFDWDNNGSYEVVDQTAASASTSFGATGSYVVGVRVRDGDGGVATGTTTVVVQPQTLGVTATNNGPVRRGQPATVTAAGTQELSDTLLYSFDWDNNGSYEVVDQTAASASTSFGATGSYVVGVRVRDGDGGVATGTTTVVVQPQTLGVTATNNGPVRRGQPATVTAAGTQELSDTLLYSFDWDNNGSYEVVDQTAASASTSFGATGSYVVGVRVRDGDGGVATGTTTVVVQPQTLGVTATNNGPVRRGQPATVTAAGTQELSDTLLYSFDWDNNGSYEVVDQTAASASTSFGATGSYVVGVRVRDGDGGVATGTTTVVVQPQTLGVTATNNGPVRRGQPATVTAAGTQELSDTLLYSFDWDNNGSYEVVDQTAASASTSFGATGSYVVGVRVRDGDGGVATGTTTVVVQPQTLTATAISNSGPVRRAQPVTVIVTGTQELADPLGYSFDWNNDALFEIGPQGSNASTMAFALGGSFTVTARITDTDGGVAITSTAVTVLPQVLQVSAIINSGPAARGAPVMVTVTATQELADPLLYSFDWDDNGSYEVVDQVANSAVTSYASTGVKTVRVRVRDASNGEVTATTAVTIVPQAVQIVAISDTSPVRRGASVQVAVTATQQLSDGLLYSFDWNNDGTYDVVDQPASSAATSYPSTGQKPVAVRVRDADGGAATGTITLTVIPQTVQVSAVTNSGPVIRNQPVQVVVTATQQLSDELTYSFDWDNDGVYDVVDQAAPVAATSYPATGQKLVGVRVRDADGGEATGATTITVSAQVIQIAAVTNSGPVTRGQSVTVNISATQQLSDALAYSFDWNGDGTYEVIDQPGSSASTTYPDAGSRVVRVRVRDSQGSVATGQTTVQVNPQMLAITAVENSGPVRSGQPVTVTVTATQELSDQLTFSFDWDGDGSYDVVDQSSAQATTSFAREGTYQVRVRVRDTQGSEATGSTMVEVTDVGGTDAPTLYLPVVLR